MIADNVLSHAETLGAYSAARQADPTLSSVTVPLDRGLELSVVLASYLTSDVRPSRPGTSKRSRPFLHPLAVRMLALPRKGGGPA